MGFAYVIEHMEEDDETTRVIPPWATLEYAHMRILAGESSEVHFTHLSQSSRDALNASFTEETALASASCFQEGVLDRINASNLSINDVACLILKPTRSSRQPMAMGILGDDPPRDRTAELRVLGFPGRRLGPIQMTTDTALGVTKIVVEDKVPLDKISYVDYPTITFNKQESVEMPFRYIAVGSEPRLPPGMRELLHEDLNKSFDF
ncbi:SAM-dependent RNA methyltransferase [Mucidula mucida]|nr:SAM-dependent RNA methyltransferase [Mucidula mucida]